MTRKRLTQLFPFLMPLRTWQRKTLFYWHLRLDGNQYARQYQQELLPYEAFQASSQMLNEKSGFPMQYQYNKAHNLRLAAKKITHLLIRPGETFSFCLAARRADRPEPYKEGLVLSGGTITGAYGGGLCQLSGLLYWLFLHTPLYILERHGHPIESFPVPGRLPFGTDATIHEGWLDLKVQNHTQYTFQIEATADDSILYARVLSDAPLMYGYEIFNREIITFTKQGRSFREVSVDCRRTQLDTGAKTEFPLYREQCQIADPDPQGGISR